MLKKLNYNLYGYYFLTFILVLISFSYKVEPIEEALRIIYNKLPVVLQIGRISTVHILYAFSMIPLTNYIVKAKAEDKKVYYLLIMQQIINAIISNVVPTSTSLVASIISIIVGMKEDKLKQAIEKQEQRKSNKKIKRSTKLRNIKKK